MLHLVGGLDRDENTAIQTSLSHQEDCNLANLNNLTESVLSSIALGLNQNVFFFNLKKKIQLKIG